MSLEQRDLGGDIPCADCGSTTNPVWYAESVFWNAVVREPEKDRVWSEILCVYCFIVRAEKMYDIVGWRLSPEMRWQPRSVPEVKEDIPAAPEKDELFDVKKRDIHNDEWLMCTDSVFCL